MILCGDDLLTNLNDDDTRARVPARGKTIFRIDLPLPPSANTAYPTNWRTKRRYLSPTGKSWKTESGWLVQAANAPTILGPYSFLILVPEKTRGDVDGYIKLAQDLMVDLRVTPDDRNAVEATARRDKSVPPGRCVVCVESAA